MKYFIRYGEIGVKSRKVRRKFEKKLMNNESGLLVTDLKDEYIAIL